MADIFLFKIQRLEYISSLVIFDTGRDDWMTDGFAFMWHVVSSVAAWADHKVPSHCHNTPKVTINMCLKPCIWRTFVLLAPYYINLNL